MSRARSRGLTCVTEDLVARLAAAPQLPEAFVRRVTELLPGDSLGYDAEQWRGAIVVVREGVVELRLRSGVRRTFAASDLLWFAGLDVDELHNPGERTTELVSVRRRGDG